MVASWRRDVAPHGVIVDRPPEASCTIPGDPDVPLARMIVVLERDTRVGRPNDVSVMSTDITHALWAAATDHRGDQRPPRTRRRLRCHRQVRTVAGTCPRSSRTV